MAFGLAPPWHLMIAELFEPRDRARLMDGMDRLDREVMAGQGSGVFRLRLRHLIADGLSEDLDWAVTRLSGADRFVAVVSPAIGRDWDSDLSRLQEFVEALSDGLAIYDPSDRLVLCNHAYRAIFAGHPVPTPVGLQYDEIVRLCVQHGVYRPIDGEIDRYVADRIAAHASGEAESLQRHSSGRIEKITEHRAASGHIVAIHSDVTAIYDAQYSALTEAGARMRFLAAVSQEIRAPLADLLALLNEFDETRDSSPDFQDRLRASGDRLMGLIANILDWSRLDSGMALPVRAAFDPVEALAPVIERHGAEAQAKGLAFRAEVPDDIGPRLGDAGRFRQIADTLLSNAVKFTDHGSVELVLSAFPGGLCLQVNDTGIGMDEAASARLSRPFEDDQPEPFGTVGSAGSIGAAWSGTPGSGLALALAHRLTRLFGGAFHVHSAPGQGSRFAVTLPFGAAGGEPEGPTPDDPQTDPAPRVRVARFSGRTALVAHGNDTSRMELSGYLARLGLDPVGVAEGRAALAACAARDFDIVLVETALPGLDGLQILSRLRAMRRFAHRPIVAISASAPPGEAARMRQAGFDDWLALPVSPRDLAQVLSHRLAEPAAAGRDPKL